MCQDNEDKVVATQEGDTVGSKVYNIEDDRSVVITKLKRKV